MICKWFREKAGWNECTYKLPKSVSVRPVSRTECGGEVTDAATGVRFTPDPDCPCYEPKEGSE